MIVPIPPLLLDLLLAFNITVALIIIATALYTENALAFSAFPTMLLIITLFRLALNITATRAILLHGYAGEVINFFGAIVVGGNYAVGFVIFLILIIIQFVVITNGAGRVAEVAARFTLDAMPGKQLAIDADLNAGLITEAEARQRRRDIQRCGGFLRRDGRCQQVRPRRRNRCSHYRRDQYHRRIYRWCRATAPFGHRVVAEVHAPHRGRRHRHASAGATDLYRDRYHRHPCARPSTDFGSDIAQSLIGTAARVPHRGDH